MKIVIKTLSLLDVMDLYIDACYKMCGSLDVKNYSQHHYAMIDSSKKLIKLEISHDDKIENGETILYVPSPYEALSLCMASDTEKDIHKLFRLSNGLVQRCECFSRIDMWGDFYDEDEHNRPTPLTVDEVLEYYKK